MLRHGCGHDTRALQAWLGHRNLQHTVRYAELALKPKPQIKKERSTLTRAAAQAGSHDPSSRHLIVR
jgi:hypothetical protein